MNVYLDASLMIALLRTEESSDVSLDYVNRTAAPLIASDFAKGEVASAVSRLVRTGDLELAAARARLEAFDEWAAAATSPLDTEPRDIHLAAQFVLQFALQLRMPDAIHLAAVRIRGLTLATLDQKLAETAQRLELNVIVPA